MEQETGVGPSALVSSFPQLLSITHCDHYERSLSARLATLRRLTRLPGRLLLGPHHPGTGTATIINLASRRTA